MGASDTAYVFFQQLSANGADPTGQRMVVITDGEETKAPFLADVIPRVRSLGIVVDTVGENLSLSADSRIRCINADVSAQFCPKDYVQQQLCVCMYMVPL